MKYLITGGCGFLGANLAAEVLRRSEELIVFDNLSRVGSQENLKWLKSLGAFEFVQGDIRAQSDIEPTVRSSKPDVVFHLAGQVAMTTSLTHPRKDFEINVVGGHNLLESVRLYSPETSILYSSTNKVYGDMEHLTYTEMPTRYVAAAHPKGFDEAVGLSFSSPYGCSKGAADQYMLDYARVYGLKTVVFRHSSIFGSRQFSTYDQGWIGWFVRKALEAREGNKAPFTISGNGKQVRDVLFITDLIRCYFAAAHAIAGARGHAFNIGGGMANSLSLVELFELLENELKVKLRYDRLPWRQSDQKVFVADISKAHSTFGWSPQVSKEAGLRNMIEWMSQLESRC